MCKVSAVNSLKLPHDQLRIMGFMMKVGYAQKRIKICTRGEDVPNVFKYLSARTALY